jgi:hypothetical protein
MAYGSPGVARAEEREDAVHAGEEERDYESQAVTGE